MCEEEGDNRDEEKWKFSFVPSLETLFKGALVIGKDPPQGSQNPRHTNRFQMEPMQCQRLEEQGSGHEDLAGLKLVFVVKSGNGVQMKDW